MRIIIFTIISLVIANLSVDAVVNKGPGSTYTVDKYGSKKTR